MTTPYGYTQASQDASFTLMYAKVFQAVIHTQYPGAENMIGASLWGQNTLGVEGLHDEVLHHTKLMGQASWLGTQERTPVPMSTFAWQDQIVADYQIYGAGWEYYNRELEDVVGGRRSIIESRAGDLPELLADREEDEHFRPFNEGESWVGGWANEPLFVDGVGNHLRILGNKTGQYGSNIIEHAGGASYHLIALLEQYGRNFISEEGRPAPIRVAKIVGSDQNIRLLDWLYGAPINLEQGNAYQPNPTRYRPELVVAEHRLDNPNDLLVFYEGYQDDLKERSKWRGWAENAIIGHMNQQKTVHIIRSRFAYYFFNNRRVVKVRGIA